MSEVRSEELLPFQGHMTYDCNPFLHVLNKYHDRIASPNSFIVLSAFGGKTSQGRQAGETATRNA